MLISITFLQYTGFITYSPNEIEFIGSFNLTNNVSIMLNINGQEYSKQLILSDYNVTKITASLDNFYLNLTAGNYTIDAYLIDNNTIVSNVNVQLTVSNEETIENITLTPKIIVLDNQNNVVQTTQTIINNCTNIQFTNKLVNKLVICKVTNGSLIYSEPKNVVQINNINITKIYVLDLSNFSITSLYSTANNIFLFKCNWNFNNNSCLNTWQNIQNLTINQEYNINLTNEVIALAEGNIIALQNITIQNETNVGLIQLQAEINKPVTWIKHINLENVTNNLTIDLPSYASNISVDKIENETKEKIKNYDIIEPKKAFTVKEIDNITINIKENVKKLEIQYETPSPLIQEQVINNYKKIVTIYSDIHYNNILTYTNLPKEFSKEKIKLYWLTNGTRILVDNVEYLDTNNNSLIDKIQWITPSLSNQTYEISISILTVQSYPTLEGNWTVQFSTTGKSDLIIKAVNGTTWSNSNELNDLKFLEVRCGSNKLNYSWTSNSVVINDYECNDIGYEISKVLTTGKHTLQFTFGNDTEYAYNYVQENSLIACRFDNNDTICNDLENATIYQSVSYEDVALHNGGVRIGWQNPWSNVSYTNLNNLKRTNMTVRMWVKPNQNYSSVGSTIQFRYFQTYCTNSTDGGGYYIIDFKDYNVSCGQFQCDGGGGAWGAWGSKPLPQNRWTYIACTFNDTHITLYVNGTKISTGAINSVYQPGTTSNDKFNLGTSIGSATLRAANATIDDFEVISNVLTPSEIVQDYKSCIPPLFSNGTLKNENWDINYTCFQTEDEINLGKGNITIFDSGVLNLNSYSNLSFYMLNITPSNSTKTIALNLSIDSKINVSQK